MMKVLIVYIVPILPYDSDGTLLTKNWDNIDIVTSQFSKRLLGGKAFNIFNGPCKGLSRAI